MIRTILLFILSASTVIGVFSFVAIHVEAMIYEKSIMPVGILPIDSIKGHGISIGLVTAAGAGVAVNDFLLRKLFVERWGIIDQAQLNKLYGRK